MKRHRLPNVISADDTQKEAVVSLKQSEPPPLPATTAISTAATIAAAYWEALAGPANSMAKAPSKAALTSRVVNEANFMIIDYCEFALANLSAIAVPAARALITPERNSLSRMKI
jgi:hypothetical protein